MEENNKVTLTEEELAQYDDVRQQLVEDIKGELATMGYEPIAQHYQGQDDLVKLVDKANKLKVQYQEAVDVIKDTYSEKVGAEKLKVLDYDHKMDMEDLANEIDKILEKDAYFREQAIIELQNTEQYKADRKEALETLALLKDIDVPYEIFGDIISKVVEAKDERTLQLVKLLAGKNATNVYIVDKAIQNVNAYRSNAELGDFAAAARTFIVDNKDPFTLHAYMQLYSDKGGK